MAEPIKFDLEAWQRGMMQQAQAFVAEMQAQTQAAFTAACANTSLPNPYASGEGMGDSDILVALHRDPELRKEVVALIQQKKTPKPGVSA